MDLPELPSPELELEKFLLSPQNLPIHDVRRAQRFWPRQADPAALYHVDVSPLHTDIAVERDLTTGELLNYHEVKLSDVGLTSKNSTSLHRTPGPPSLSVKGDPTNYPFWPGGMKESEVVRKVKEEEDASSLDFKHNLLTIPPGFKEGMVLDNSSPVNTASANLSLSEAGAQTVSISELLFGHEGAGEAGQLLDWGEEDREENSEQDKAAAVEDDDVNQTREVYNDVESEETLDGVLTEVKGHSQPTLDTGGGAAATTKDEWVVKIDVNAPVEDFHQRIPNMAHEWKFKLDPFQKQAVLRLEEHESVFVAAHTSAGKTVVAEYAIALSISHRTRVIYTSPIKALSNQKFRDFRKTFGEDVVGLLTGDVQIRPEAPCLIMTTEILRSMLYNGSDVIRDVEWVVFDEVHYINDSERGVVWEEVLIMLPEHVHVIMLSATVPNAMEFADWVGRTKQKRIYVISTLKRPVPLKHYLYTGNSKQTNDQLFELVGEDKQFKTKGYQAALDAKKAKSTKGASNFGPKSRQYANPKQDKNVWLSLVNMLQKKDKLQKDKLPVVAFTFSRNRCNDNADSLTTLDLTTVTQKSEIHVFFQKSISLLKGSDQKLPQVIWMRELLKRGIAVHHSGILPIIKEVIELLFQRGLVKLLFATETFAMGVNMPARTVVFDSTRKHDGIRMRDLYPGEYVQMAGRAGRRGLDDSGTVILLCKSDVPEASDLYKMILGRPTTLQSQFRLTYSMLLNLMRVETLRVEDMMKRSFAEMDSARHEVDRRQALDSLENNIVGLQGQEECPLCLQDIDHYFSACARIAELQKEMQELVLSNPQVLKALSPGRVVVLDSPVYRYCLAVVLQQNTKKAIKTFTVLMLCNAGQDSEDVAPTLVDVEQYKVVTPYQTMTELFHPEGSVHHAVVEVDGQLVVGITRETLKVESSKIVEDYRKRQIPRFRGNPPWPATATASQELLRIVEAHSGGIPLLDPVADFKLTSMDFVEKKMEKQQFEQTMAYYSCLNCPQFKEHFGVARQKARLQEQLSSLKFMLSEASLQLLPEYKQRVQVLKHLNYLGENGSVELKGRVACELHSHEVLLTELLFQNVFANFSPAEIVALLSCMVFQQSKCSEPNLTQQLQKGKEAILTVARSIAETERQFGLDVSVDDYLRELKFGLVEVVFEWGNGMEFVEITKLTDVLEGMMVRCIQRLDETCKDVRNAARVIGDPKLQHKMQEASRLIKRDIVFAASLYTI